MLSKAILTGALVGFIFLFFSWYIFYDSLTTDFFSQHYLNMPAMMAAEMNYIARGVLVEANLISVIYSKWTKGEYNLRSGFKISDLLRFFVGLGIIWKTLGTLELIDIQGSLIGTVWIIVYFGVEGYLNGWIFEKLV